MRSIWDMQEGSVVVLWRSLGLAQGLDSIVRRMASSGYPDTKAIWSTVLWQVPKIFADRRYPVERFIKEAVVDDVLKGRVSW